MSSTASVKIPAQFGSWPSALSAQLVAEGVLTFSEVSIVDGHVYWLEARPAEEGRITLVSWQKGIGTKELLPKDYSVRSRVHEYGGGALLATEEAVYFVRAQDQQVYRLDSNGNITKLTPFTSTTCFADGSLHPTDGRLFYVMEERSGAKAINSIVSIDQQTGEVKKVVQGNDFYSHPRVSPDGKKLAYITWNLPYLPWDGTELWVLDLTTGSKELIVGNEVTSITDAQWSPTGELVYVTDESGWWNLHKNSQPIFVHEAEYALPQWLFNRALYGFSGNSIFSSYVKAGVNYCALIGEGTFKEIDLPYTIIRSVSVAGTQVALVASAPDQPYEIALYDIATGQTEIIKKSIAVNVDPGYISWPVALEFPTTGNRSAHAFYYAPANPQHIGLENEKPPLIVLSHGGPTAHVAPQFNLSILFWTSRGFAVIDVNYGGSTGYGRPYRERLTGQWGIVDVDDCTNAALYCVEQGLADPERLAIAGGSAGGFTTLAALAFKDVFKVGANYYGVSDIEQLAIDTYKFESGYFDTLIGPYPAEKATYRARSPIHSAHQIKRPIIIFQGDEDLVVPPSQSEMIYQSLLERKIPTAYLLFKGEQHGFRKAVNIQRSLEAQLYFFAQILQFPLGEQIEPVEIMNL